MAARRSSVQLAAAAAPQRMAQQPLALWVLPRRHWSHQEGRCWWQVHLGLGEQVAVC